MYHLDVELLLYKQNFLNLILIVSFRYIEKKDTMINTKLLDFKRFGFR